MKNTSVPLIEYATVLSQIEGQENHLLLGNGFNLSLGINTSYQAIFEQLLEDNLGIYKDAKELVNECNYDLEVFIGKLLESIDQENLFLRKYIGNKIKSDFMRATHQIVKDKIKDVYAEKNEGIYFLLKNFTNYFTLNYDSFLYLLLLNFNPSTNSISTTIGFQNSLKFIEEDSKEEKNHLFEEIRQLRLTGQIQLKAETEFETTSKKLNHTKKTRFLAYVKEYSETNKRGWKQKDIEQVVRLILHEEKKELMSANINDGAQLSLFDGQKEYIYNIESNTQNLFFLHGAFHIYKEKQFIKKITQETDKALYERLELVLNNEDQEIICVFQSENKLEIIEKNQYLKKCYDKLSNLSGNLVIIGCSLADNDNHIFNQINKSNVENIYITSKESSILSNYEKAIEKFPNKNIIIINADTISYELPT
jgi:hypothetical protein